MREIELAEPAAQRRRLAAARREPHRAAPALELAGVTADRINGARAYRGLALAPEGG